VNWLLNKLKEILKMPGQNNAVVRDEDYDRYNTPRTGAVVHDGSIADADFKVLTDMIAKYGPTVIVQKVGKVCERKAATLGNTWEGQSIKSAYSGVANKIKTSFNGPGVG
jgi:hypothetical protein